MGHDGALRAYGVKRILVGQNMEYTMCFSLDQTGVLVDFSLILRVFSRSGDMLGGTSH